MRRDLTYDVAAAPTILTYFFGSALRRTKDVSGPALTSATNTGQPKVGVADMAAITNLI